MTVLDQRPLSEERSGERTDTDPRVSPGNRPAWRRFWRGRPGDPAWVRPALLALLAGTALLYLAGLSVSGWGDGFYSAAVQAATKSWKAFFFGSSDAGNFITVDKPPAALWVTDLSVRLFGVSSWSVLVPQALEGVACVGLLYITVRRCWSAGTALLAGLLLAVTPAAAVIFRLNKPDALLVLLLVAAVYATVRAIQSGRTAWLILAGALVGLGFITKMLEAFLVVPAIGVAYLAAGTPRLRRRLVQLAVAGVATVVSSAWWVVAVELTPASDRPYVGGSPNNDLLSLIFGYNGLGRLSGSEVGSVGFQGPTSAGGGGTSVFRMFNPQFGNYIAWLLPAAVVACVLGLVVTRRRPRTDPQRATFLLWGAWLVVTAAAFSLGQGIIHPYYSVALAPPVAALTAAGCALLWAKRGEVRGRVGFSAITVVTLAASAVVLTGAGQPSAGKLVVFTAIVVVGGGAVLAAPALRRRVRVVVLGLVAALCLGGSIGTTLGVINTPRKSVPAPAARTAAGCRGPGWVLCGVVPTRAVTERLDVDAPRYTWVAATAGSEVAASYQLATGHAVIPLGGFNATDPTPTLARFQALVAHGRVHWFIAGPLGRWPGGPDVAAVTNWVERSFPETTVDGARLFDLTA